MVVRLPGSVLAGAMITAEIDGVKGTPERTDSNFVKQSDGSWKSTESIPSSTLCSYLDPGNHIVRALDENDNVLAQGSFTITP
jgi:hypothetical protein